jgi:hypothetical protein
MGGNDNINWKNPVKGVHYVVVSELPEDIQKPFEDWLKGQTRPMVEKEGDKMFDCAFHWDYTNFLMKFCRK